MKKTVKIVEEKPSIPTDEEIEKKAENYAHDSYKTPENKEGDTIVQRVGQNPYGYSKHVKQSKKHFLAGYKQALKDLGYADN
jgi:hypothetical protein